MFQRVVLAVSAAVSKTDEFCIKNEKLCIKNEESCIEMMNFAADYRGWSGAFWFQNTLHSYWPRLADADFDTMEPWFDMFVETLPLAEERNQAWYRHRGAWWHEMVSFQWKNPDFLLRNVDFLLKNVDFIMKQMWSFGALPSDVYG